MSLFLLYPQAKPTLLSLLDLTDTIVGLVFLPVEHLAFFGDQKLATYQTDSLHTASTVLWLTSLLLNLSQLLIKIASSSVSSSSLILPLVQCSSDIVLAVHYLPQGLLWSQKLPLPAVGLFGLISSLVGLYRLINDYRSKKLKSWWIFILIKNYFFIPNYYFYELNSGNKNSDLLLKVSTLPINSCLLSIAINAVSLVFELAFGYCYIIFSCWSYVQVIFRIFIIHTYYIVWPLGIVALHSIKKK